MNDLIIEIAIYLALAALLGFVLGFLVWGLGARRRIEAARAEGAAGVRTTVDGDSSLKTRIQALTRERDRLEHRVEVLTVKLAALQETAHGADHEAAVAAVEERLGTVRMRMRDEAGDPLTAAAGSFPRPAPPAAAPDQSIFAAHEEPVGTEAAPADAPPTEDRSVDGEAGDTVEEPLLLRNPLPPGAGRTDETQEAEHPRGRARHLFFHREKPATRSAAEVPPTGEKADDVAPVRRELAERIRIGPSTRVAPSDPVEVYRGTGAGSSPHFADGPAAPSADAAATTRGSAGPATAEPAAKEPPVAEPVPREPEKPFVWKAEGLADDVDPPGRSSAEDGAGHDSPASAAISPRPLFSIGRRQRESAGAGGDQPESGPPEVTSAALATDDEQSPDKTPRPAFLLDERPDDADDLTLISGIGQRTAEALNRNGVYRFSQLAEMSPEDAAWLRQAVSAFPNRIERDDWSGQARRLIRDEPDGD